MTSKQQKRLTQFHDEYKQTEQRLQMAIQTLQGAQADLQSKRMRFEAAVEFVGGPGATWTYNPDDGVVVLEAGAKSPTPEPVAQNGAPALLPNRAARRKAGKMLGSK
ncbi:MAG: hypothetical protein ACHQC8_02550 [Solirubrobacterales bacterium]